MPHAAHRQHGWCERCSDVALAHFLQLHPLEHRALPPWASVHRLAAGAFPVPGTVSAAAPDACRATWAARRCKACRDMKAQTVEMM